MYDVLQLGRFTIYVPYLIHLAAALITVLWVYIAGKKHVQKGKELADLWLESWIISVLIWKFSYAVFHPVSVIKHPSYLLYFSGGEKGLVLGYVMAILYFIYKSKKWFQTFTRQVVFFGSTAVLYWSLTQFVNMLFMPDLWVLYTLKILYFTVIALLIWKHEWYVTKIYQIRIAEWFLFGLILFKILTGNFSISDIWLWFIFVLAFVLVILDVKDGIKND